MSADKPEIIPPKHPLPATREEHRGLPARQEAVLPNSAASSALTGFQARIQTRALQEVGANIQARTAVQDAETARRESALKLLRTVHKLEEAPEFCALDRAERQAERAAKYAEISASYEQLGENSDERVHQAELRKLARQAELEEAKRKFVEAQRQTFTVKQGLENQQRLKKLNLKIWARRKQGVHLDAVAAEAKLQQEVTAISGNDAASSDDNFRTKAEDALIAAAQSGDAAAVERWKRVLDALDGA